MCQAKQDLLDFLKRQCTSKDDFLSCIKKCKVNQVLVDQLKGISIDEYKETTNILDAQRKFNKIREEELKSISEAFEAKGVKIIHLKGLYLAVDLYDVIDERSSGDIDLLVDSDDMEMALNILHKLGYSTNLYDITDENESTDYRKYDIQRILKGLARCYHIFGINKQVENEDGSTYIQIDLHARIINNYSENWPYMKEVMSRAIKQRMLGNDVWLLELHDRLISLMSHSTEEYIQKSINHLLVYDKNYYTDISKLHDIALLIDKYKDEIKWEILDKRSKDWGADGDLLLACKLLNVIYPNRVPDWFLNKIYNKPVNINKYSKYNSIVMRALPVLLAIDPLELIFTDTQDKFVRILNNLTWVGPSLLCPKITDGKYKKSSNLFIIDENSDNKPNIFGTYFKAGDRSFGHNLRIENYVWWDDSYFNLNTAIKINRQCLADDFIKDSWISINLGTDGVSGCSANVPFLRNFIFRVSEKDGEKILVWRKYYVWDRESSDYPYPYNLKFYENKCEVLISIPWEFLGVNPCNDMNIWLDVEASINNSKDNTQKCTLAWANPSSHSQPYDDITFLGKMSLKN